MRVALVGAGKRMTETYVPLLRALGEDIVGFTTRTSATASRFASATGVRSYASIGELYRENPDYFIVCVSPNAIAPCARPLFSLGRPVLIETPIEDLMLADEAKRMNATVGVLEQWPFLPLEQFKARVYEKGLISRPFLVRNDCRSYDYHAIAQLRSYIGRQDGNGRDIMPISAKGTHISTPLRFEGSDGKLQTVTDAWDLATIEFDNGAVLCHEFSYACKVAPFRSIQTLRAYSVDGTMVTGRIFNRSNDYEIIDIERLDDGKPVKLDVWIAGSPAGGIAKIFSDEVEWVNPFADLDFNESSVAIASHLRRMEGVVQGGEKPLYSLHDAALDQYIMLAIKQACMRNATLQLKV